jgi:hypothetical protein
MSVGGPAAIAMPQRTPFRGRARSHRCPVTQQAHRRESTATGRVHCTTWQRTSVRQTATHWALRSERSSPWLTYRRRRGAQT